MSSSPFIFFFVFVFVFFSLCTPSSSSAPLLAPVHKDHTTRQYTLTLYLKTPPQLTTLVLDLGASFTWIDCTQTYISSSYHPIPCSAALCRALGSGVCSDCFGPPRPGCANDSCALLPENSVTRKRIAGQALVDLLALPNTTDNRNASQLAFVPEFVFSCSEASLLQGLAEGVVGVAGLARSNFSLPAQVSTAFSSPYLFALCLSGSRSAPGILFFNSPGPYFFLPEIDLSKTLIYTPLILNPAGTTVISTYPQPFDAYFIGVTAIKVNGKDVPINKTLLTVDQATGFGGTRISTTTPYTVLQTSIYEAFKEAFVNESAALNLTVAKPADPFGVCYSAGDVISTRVGPAVPTVDLVMQSSDVFWRIFGSNSMVRIAMEDADAWCLGFVDGGANTSEAMVIGGHQMEDNLLQFDVGSKRLGFSSSVLARGTTCANFNFSS